MANLQVAWNPTTYTAKIQTDGASVGSGFTKIDSFVHADVENAIEDLEFDVNHVWYHHVRDALYHQNVLDMQRVTIQNAVA